MLITVCEECCIAIYILCIYSLNQVAAGRGNKFKVLYASVCLYLYGKVN